MVVRVKDSFRSQPLGRAVEIVLFYGIWQYAVLKIEYSGNCVDHFK